MTEDVAKQMLRDLERHYGEPVLPLHRFREAVERGARDVMAEKQTLLPPGTLQHGELRIDGGARTATIAGQAMPLKRREFDLLWFLALNAGIVLTRAVILERLWGADYDGDERTVDVHVRRLRKALGTYRDYVRTTQCVGYCLRVPAPEHAARHLRAA